MYFGDYFLTQSLTSLFSTHASILVSIGTSENTNNATSTSIVYPLWLYQKTNTKNRKYYF